MGGGGTLAVGEPALLPVHGFVLAGGKSSRMGSDKALLQLGGRKLIEIAVGKLAGVCAEVWIAGNRADLGEFAPVVMDSRLDAGPGAGIEAGLRAALRDWSLFLPVDVPFLPAEFLRAWASEVLASHGLRASYVVAEGQVHPSICVLQRGCLGPVSDALERGERRLTRLFDAIREEFGDDSVAVWDAAKFGAASGCFLNLNTGKEFGDAERILGAAGAAPACGDGAL